MAYEECMADVRTEKSLFEMTDEELEAKIQRLTRIVFSSNWNLSRQAQPILKEMYAEQGRRNDKKFEEHLEKNGVKMDEIINIG